jgi:hypothetical protein
MSLQHRNALAGQIVEMQPSIRGFVSDSSSVCLIAGSWDMMSYSFQCGFEAMWDLARADNGGLLELPLLSLWRQSVELSFKSAISDIEGGIEKSPNHDLTKLFQKLAKISTDVGLSLDDDLTRDVEAMIEQVQSFDPFADRFRYPENKRGESYEGITVDLDKLFQAHWIIVTWCEGVVVEIGEKFGIGPPP